MKLLCFATFWFFSICTFLRLWHFISPTAYPISPIFSGVVCIYNSHVFNEAFFLLAIVSLIIEKMSFSYVHGNLCQGKIPSSNYAAYHPRLSLKKWNQMIKSTEGKSSQNCILQPIIKVRCPSNRVKTHQKLFFWLLLPFVIMLLKGFYFLLKMYYFSLDIFCSNLLKFSNGFIKS